MAGIIINSNPCSLSIERRLGMNTIQLEQSFTRLSSGLRINRASDDAAGLSIAALLNVDSRVYSQGVRNINDGVSMLSIAEGALGELSSITTRQLEIAEQAANGALTFAQRKALTAEANALGSEFNRIVRTLQFNGRSLLDVESSPVSAKVQAAYGQSGSIDVELGTRMARTVGRGIFDDAIYLSSNSSPSQDALLVDVNKDGQLDLITTAPSGTDTTSVRLGNGNGSFAAPRSVSTSTTSPYCLAVADLDNDGNVDIVAGGTQVGMEQLSVSLGNGDGRFKAGVAYSGSNNSYANISLVDMNQDGALDIVGTGTDWANHAFTAVRFGNGNGTFKDEIFSLTPETFMVYESAVWDINADGRQDVVIAGRTATNGAVSVFLAERDGSFTRAATYVMDSCATTGVAFGDLNGDGVSDLATCGYDNSLVGSVSVRFGNSNGTFGTAINYDPAFGKNSTAIEMTDLSGDGIPDLVVTGKTDVFQDVMTVFTGNADGTLNRQTRRATGLSDTRSVTAGDLNGDGAADLVVVGYDLGQPAILLAQTTRTAQIPRLDLYTEQSAQNAIPLLRAQLERVSSEIGSIGATGSRLATALANLQVGRENFDSAASQMTDVDVAFESAKLLRAQILQQAASAVLTQANTVPQLALALLNGE